MTARRSKNRDAEKNAIAEMVAHRRQQREELMRRIAAVARYDETLTKQALAARFRVDTKTVTRALQAVRP